MKTLANAADKRDALVRLAMVRPDLEARWGRMSAHQTICHFNDSFLAVMGEKYVSPATRPLQRSVVKWIALDAPIRWPKGLPTRPEMQRASNFSGKCPTRRGSVGATCIRIIIYGNSVCDLN
jgi:hypothetical protein